jgi:hypothetical protein
MGVLSENPRPKQAWYAAGSALIYSRLIGGAAADLGNGLAVDAQGRAFLIGSTSSTNFPVTLPLQPDNRGGSDAFISMLDPEGNLQYATYLGGSGVDIGTGIALDAAGNIFVTGFSQSADFPLAHAVQSKLGNANCLGAQNCGDAFVAKLDPAGTTLVFSTFLGGSADDNSTAAASGAGLSLYGIVLDSSGFAYVTGTTASLDFPILGGLQLSPRRGSSDPFLTKFQPDGAVVYSAVLGPGTINAGQIWATAGSSVVVDAQGNAYVAGASLPPQAGPGAGSGPRGYLAKVFDLPMIPTASSSLPGAGGPPAFLHISSLRRLADSSSQLSFVVSTNSGYTVEGSTDLRTWKSMLTQPPPGQSDGTGGGKR